MSLTLQYAYGISFRITSTEPYTFLGHSSFPTPPKVGQEIVIGGMLCSVDEVDEQSTFLNVTALYRSVMNEVNERASQWPETSHNPLGLTYWKQDQGYRLLDKDEIKGGKGLPEIEIWCPGSKIFDCEYNWVGNLPDEVYITRCSRSELAALRAQ